MSRHYELVLSLLLLFGASGGVMAEDRYAFAFIPNTGDIAIDTRLGDFNVYASGNVDGFVDELVVSYGAPRRLVREYVVERRWPPGDVYYACALAYYSRHSCSSVLNMYQHDHRRGWGLLAKRLGVTPGTPAFHTLKGNIGKSHAKWHGRPEHAGEQGKGHGKAKGKDKGRGRD